MKDHPTPHVPGVRLQVPSKKPHAKEVSIIGCNKDLGIFEGEDSLPYLLVSLME